MQIAHVRWCRDTPETSTVDLLNQILAGQNKLSSDIAALRAQQASVERPLTDLTSRFPDLEKQTGRIDTIEQTIQSLQAKVVDLEDRSRRSNLIVFGLPEEPKETDTILKQKVITELFNNKLGVPCSSVGRIHRLGKPSGKVRSKYYQRPKKDREDLDASCVKSGVAGTAWLNSSSVKELWLLNIDARSVVNKSEQLEAVILGHDPHVLAITETWLHDWIDDSDVFPTDCHVFRRDRSTRGGGIAVLVEHNIQAFLSRQLDHHESITLKLYYWGRSILLFAVYRPPDSPPHFLAALSEHEHI